MLGELQNYLIIQPDICIIQITDYTVLAKDMGDIVKTCE
jgi:hypothetical protein